MHLTLAVNGTLMRGLELNGNLLAAGAEFVAETRTAPVYRLWSIGDHYPAMLWDPQGGAAIALELWQVSPQGLVQILEGEPLGLCLGRVMLADGRAVWGILADPHLVLGQTEITSFGGWRAYLAGKDLSPL